MRADQRRYPRCPRLRCQLRDGDHRDQRLWAREDCRKCARLGRKRKRWMRRHMFVSWSHAHHGGCLTRASFHCVTRSNPRIHHCAAAVSGQVIVSMGMICTNGRRSENVTSPKKSAAEITPLLIFAATFIFLTRGQNTGLQTNLPTSYRN